ncbi:hypothetical protein [Loktanella sp. 3ANDIMAR09]|nr:hypothetical protein [Loktanella sp. 3ANDIMAR09]
MMTRRLTVVTVFALLLGLLGVDLANSAPLDPFQAPPALALGSGLAGAGAHCAALPTAD